MDAKVFSSRRGVFSFASVSGLLGATVLASSLIWACGDASDRADDAWGDAAPDSRITTSYDASYDRGVRPTFGIPTEQGLKVAFFGDTAHGDNFLDVLALVKRESTDMMMIQGDLTYGLFTSPNDWFKVIDNSVNAAWAGSSADVTIPFFVAKGNHDSDWSEIGGGLSARMTSWGVAPDDGDPTTQNYAVTYNGLKMVMVTDSETTPSRAEYVESQLANDQHVWKICAWHKNMRASNVGPKDDEMSWTIYETCRKYGAIVAQAHSHTYSRSKTLIDDASQTVDPNCSDPFAVCIAPGRHFFFDSSLGGKDTRSVETDIAGQPYWAASYTGSYGALFIEFYVDGDPAKARAYFKTVGDQIVDPPASSGQTSFTITRSN
jgi:hypothetical protein